ncbi:MAG: hypothetical protein M1831_000037 [Alyxoria varia]|nr:MAG: hypothetical protein M1831_000037 [Alyxoria varia]
MQVLNGLKYVAFSAPLAQHSFAIPAPKPQETFYSAPEASRTFDFTAGDVGYFPVPFPHYIENTGDEPVVFLEVLQAPLFTDISVTQCLELTPKQVVKDTLHLSQEVVESLPKSKPCMKPGTGKRDDLQTDCGGKVE